MDARKTMDHALRQILRNSHGYTLPYVLMIVVILSLFIPPLLNVISTRQATDIQRVNQKEAIYIADSAAEAYILYLKGFTQPPTITDLTTNYPGYSASPKSIQMPGGKTYSYVLDCTGGPSTGYNYTLKVSVQVGKASKTILYTFNATPISGGSGGTGGANTIDGSTDPLLSPSTNKSSDGVITVATDPNFQSDFTKTVPTVFDFPQTSGGTTTTWSSFSDIIANQKAILNASVPGSTVTIKLTSASFDVNQDYDLTTLIPNRTIVLYVTGPGNTPTIMSIDGNLQMNGMLIVNGNVNNDGTISLGHESSQNIGQPGNLLVSGTYNMDGKNATFTSVNGTLAAADVIFRQGNSDHPNISQSNNSYSYANGFTGTGTSTSWSPNPVRSQ